MYQELEDLVFHTSVGAFTFIMILTIIISLLSALLARKLVDTAQIERKQRQIKAHEAEKQKIIDLAEIDVNRYRKARKRWERKEVIFKQSQQKMSMARMKPMCIQTLPIMIVWIVSNSLIGFTPVAVSPMNAEYVPLIGQTIMLANHAPWIGASAWYMLCSISFNSLMRRAFKVQTQSTGGGFGEMLSGQKAKALEFPDI